MSARESPPSAKLSDEAYADLNNAGPSVRHAVLELFERGGPQGRDARPFPGQKDWFVARVSYRSVLYRWMRPEELEDHGYPSSAQVAVITRVTDIPLPGRTSLLLPGGVAIVAPIIALALAPDDLEQAASTFFATSASVIATLFIALALEARAALVDVRFALTTVFYVALGLIASTIGSLMSLGGPAYDWLLVFTVAGGMGALASTLLIAGWSLARKN